MENGIIIGGFQSVEAVISSGSRKINKVTIDKNRYGSIKRSKYHPREKLQYKRLFEFCDTNGISIDFLSKQDFEKIPGSNKYYGIAVHSGERRYKKIDDIINIDKKLYVILEGIEDPYNYGQLVRTLYAAGVGGLFINGRREYSGSEDIVIRASAGASEMIETAVYDDLPRLLDKLQSKGISIAATDNNDSAVDLYSFEPKSPLCVIFGGERRGISKAVLEKCDHIIKISYNSNIRFSLSACSAASIIIFETARHIYSQFK